MTGIQLAVFSYAILALFSFILLCNTLASQKTGFERKRITPMTAFFLGLIWPIGVLAAYVAFIRNR